MLNGHLQHEDFVLSHPTLYSMPVPQSRTEHGLARPSNRRLTELCLLQELPALTNIKSLQRSLDCRLCHFCLLLSQPHPAGSHSLNQLKVLCPAQQLLGPAKHPSLCLASVHQYNQLHSAWVVRAPWLAAQHQSQATASVLGPLPPVPRPCQQLLKTSRRPLA